MMAYYVNNGVALRGSVLVAIINMYDLSYGGSPGRQSVAWLCTENELRTTDAAP